MMAERFVQVEVGLPRSKLIDRARTVLALSRPCAVGHFTLLWLAVMETGCEGKLDDRSDLWIEEAAGWQGEPGKFAAFVRKHHLTDGAIDGWAEKYATVDAARKRNRERMRATRQGNGASTVPDTVHAQTAHVSDTPLLLSSSPAVGSSGAIPEKEPVGGEEGTPRPGIGEFDEFTDDVVQTLRGAQRPRALLATLRMLVQEGNDAALVGRAVREMAANGEAFNAARFRGFLRSLKREPERAAEAKRPTGGDALIRAALDEALAWSRRRGGYKHIVASDYLAGLPEPTRAALAACGGLKAFETADEIGLRALTKQFIAAWPQGGDRARA